MSSFVSMFPNTSCLVELSRYTLYLSAKRVPFWSAVDAYSIGILYNMPAGAKKILCTPINSVDKGCHTRVDKES